MGAKRLERRIAIVGSRTYPLTRSVFAGLDDLARVKAQEEGKAIVDSFFSHLVGDVHIISGGAQGPDTWAAELAKESGFRLTELRPNWRKHGRGAGFKRNSDIVGLADDVVAFWDLESNGTWDTIRKSAELERDLMIFGPEGKLFFWATQEDYKGKKSLLVTALERKEARGKRTNDPSQGQGNQAGVHTEA